MSGPMGLVYPTPGDTTDTWGVVLNQLLGLVENHDHTPGKGSLVPSAGIGINADLSFGAFALTLAKAITFTEQAPAAMVGYSSALFASSADHNLYWRNSSGTNVQITAGSTLNVSIVGGIGGDYASVGALFSYDDATRRYLAQQEGSPRPWAGFGTGDIDLYQKAASISNKVTLKSPSALAASYAVTWLAALPGALSIMQIDNTGAMTASNTIPTPSAPDYKWSAVRDIPIPLQPVAALITNVGYSGDFISLTSSGVSWDARTQVISELRAGDRIIGAETTSTLGAGTMQLRIDKINSGAASSTGNTINVTTGLNQSATFTPSSYTLQANESVYIDISGSATGATLKQLILHVDRP